MNQNIPGRIQCELPARAAHVHPPGLFTCSEDCRDLACPQVGSSKQMVLRVGNVEQVAVERSSLRMVKFRLLETSVAVALRSASDYVEDLALAVPKAPK